MKTLPVLARATLCLLVAATATGAETPRRSGVQTADVDRSVRPQDHLFAYANGTWLRDVPIPADRSRFGVDSMMQENSLVQQRTLLESAPHAVRADARKAAQFYASYLDTAAVERRGLAPLRGELERIAAITTRADLSAALGRFNRIAVATPVEVYVQPDAKDTRRQALWFTQSGLGLPDRDYYFKDAAHFVELRSKYRAHVAALLRLAQDADADAQAGAIVAFETELARSQWTVVDRRDPVKTFNPRTLAQIQDAAPAIDWKVYLAAAGVPESRVRLVVRQPDYLSAMAQHLAATPLPVVKAYLRYRLISDYAAFLPGAFADEDFAFNERTLHDTPRAPERWKRACALVDRLMGDALGRLYAERHFPPSAKEGAEKLVANLMASYRRSIETLDWLSPATRQQALVKLGKIRIKIGYPATWRDYSALAIAPDDLAGNVLRARAFESARQFAKLSRAVDRGAWEMTAPTVDAGYSAATNSIEFPAGVLQPPLYDPAADDAYNYGNTGATIGHEISHAFDNRGSRYDGDGALRDWWTPQDHAAFDARTRMLVDEFNAFEPVPGHHVDGVLTLSENIADLAGLKIAWIAYVASLHGRAAPVIDGWTGAQRFFLGYAQSYKGKRRDELLIAQLATNPHAPEQDRVDGIVVHSPGFYAAFGVQPGDALYRPADQRVDLW